VNFIKKHFSTNVESFISSEVNGGLILKGKSLMSKSEIIIRIIADGREQKSEVVQSLLGIENVAVFHTSISFSGNRTPNIFA